MSVERHGIGDLASINASMLFRIGSIPDDRLVGEAKAHETGSIRPTNGNPKQIRDLMQHVHPTVEGGVPGRISAFRNSLVLSTGSQRVSCTGDGHPPVDRGTSKVVVQTTGPAMVGAARSPICRNGLSNTASLSFKRKLRRDQRRGQPHAHASPTS